jgi:hypothetical protein
MKRLSQITLALLTISALIGCSSKVEPVKVETKWRTKIEYREAKRYDFQKVDLTGVYIELKDVETRKLCTPSLLEARDIYTGVIKYYELMIDEYKRDMNSTKE